MDPEGTGGRRHVLCAKSFARNADEAREGARAAAENGSVLMDACRYDPVFRRAKEVVDEGLLEPVPTVEAALPVRGLDLA